MRPTKALVNTLLVCKGMMANGLALKWIFCIWLLVAASGS